MWRTTGGRKFLENTDALCFFWVNTMVEYNESLSGGLVFVDSQIEMLSARLACLFSGEILRIWSFDWFGCASNTNGRTELDPWISFSKSIRKTVPAPKLLPMSPVFHEPVLVPEELELDSVSWQPWRQVVSGHAVDHMSVWIEPIRLHLNSNRRKILQVNCNAKYV